jgi:hypothetical protein
MDRKRLERQREAAQRELQEAERELDDAAAQRDQPSGGQARSGWTGCGLGTKDFCGRAKPMCDRVFGMCARALEGSWSPGLWS